MTDAERPTLLIVDDEVDILDAVERLLRKDYTVLTAQTSEEAWEHLENGEVHVVLSDQRMPTMSGVDLLADIRQRFPDIVRVLLTGYSNIDHVIDAINEGHVYRYVSKPWDPSEFKTVVRQCVERAEARAERKQLIETLEQQNALLQQKNEELKTLDRVKDVFMEVVSHELNTPIAVILGYAFLLKRETGTDENEVIRKAVAGIESSGDRLKNISTSIFKMLERAHQHSLAVETLELAVLFSTVREYVSPFLEKRKQKLEIDVASDSETIDGDRAKVEDVLLNIIMNAIKFSYDGQTISIRASAAADDFVLIEVEDEGIGIAEDDLDQVFNPFFSTFESQYHSSGDFEFGKRGIGLGLAVAQRFAELHGGHIYVESKRGQGSIFKIYLPREPNPIGSPHVERLG